MPLPERTIVSLPRGLRMIAQLFLALGAGLLGWLPRHHRLPGLGVFEGSLPTNIKSSFWLSCSI